MFNESVYGAPITNDKTITVQGKQAMDAYQLNPSKPDTMAYDINKLKTDMASKLNRTANNTFMSEQTGTSKAGWYFKIATINNIGLYTDGTMVGSLISYYPNMLEPRYIKFIWRVKQQESITRARLISLQRYNFDLSNLVAMRTNNSGNSFNYELWCKASDTFEYFVFTPECSVGNIDINDNMLLQQNLPQTTNVITCIDG